MRILMTGGTGYIGRALCPKLTERGHDVTVYSRQPSEVPRLCGEAVKGVDSLDAITSRKPYDAVINLAGEPIAGWLWTESRKQKLRDSRVRLTNRLCRALESAGMSPGIFISGSAIGYYGDGKNEVLTEANGPQDSFDAELCADWERAADTAASWGARVVKLRTGLVLGPDGGFLGPLKLPFSLCLGGRLGSGDQWMSWVSRDDMVRIILFLLDNEQCEGAFNACAPNPVTNREFTRAFARALSRPTFIPVPAFALKLGLGELSRLLLTGQRAIPERLIGAGFEFEDPDIETALAKAVD